MSPTQDPPFTLSALSPEAFARLGVEHVAYMKPVLVDGVAAIAIHAADGTPIGAAPDVDLAAAAILQHELAPARLH